MRLLILLTAFAVTGCTALEEAQERSEIASQERAEHLQRIREISCADGRCGSRLITVTKEQGGEVTRMRVRVPRRYLD